MQNDLTLDTLDRDGAIREGLDGLEGDTRAGFLSRAAVAAGGLLGGAAVLGLTPSTVAAATRGDRAILNFALTLEYLEAAFYAEALREGGARSGPVREFARTVAAHERSHVRALRKVLGRSAIAEPSFDFRNTTSSRSRFLATAIQLEDTGVAAYKGQAPLIDSKAILASALAIHSVEARHAGWARTLVEGENPVPAPVDAPATRAQVLRAVRATRFIQS
jgi:rubrerythrin